MSKAPSTLKSPANPFQTKRLDFKAWEHAQEVEQNGSARFRSSDEVEEHLKRLLSDQYARVMAEGKGYRPSSAPATPSNSFPGGRESKMGKSNQPEQTRTSQQFQRMPPPSDQYDPRQYESAFESHRPLALNQSFENFSIESPKRSRTPRSATSSTSAASSHRGRSIQRDRRKTRNETPGPAAYTPHSQPSTSTHGYSFPTTPRSVVPSSPYILDIKVPTTPGPGAYVESTSTPKGPAYTMPRDRSPRRGVDRQCTTSDAVGPGSYSTPRSATGPAYSIPKKRDSQVIVPTPGPGSYESTSPTRRAPAYSIGTSPRAGFPCSPPRSVTPAGPGSYNVSSQSFGGPAYSIPSYGAKSRSRTPEPPLTPGPGSYDVGRSRSSSRGAVPFGSADKSPGRPWTSPREYYPGPGAYDNHSNPSTPRSPSYSIPKQKRTNRAEYGPGPGQYAPPVTTPRKEGPAYSMEGPSRQPFVPPPERLSTGRIGPGAYTVNQSTLGGPAYSIPREKQKQTLVSTPGPGRYQPVNPSAPKSPAHVIPTSPRAELRKWEITPGPGAYDPRATLPRSPSYKISPPRARPPSESTPGPGQYQHRTYIGSDGPAVSMSFRNNFDEDPPLPAKKAWEETPGPASYTPTSSKKGPQYSMGSRSKSPIDLAMPGPGQYENVRGSFGGPSYTMGSRAGGKGADNTPGPGQYAILEPREPFMHFTPSPTVPRKSRPAGETTPGRQRPRPTRPSSAK